MIRQKDIHLKLAYSILDELDKEVAASGEPRNRIINAAIKVYLAFKDCDRRCHNLPPEEAREEALDTLLWTFTYLHDTLAH